MSGQILLGRGRELQTAGDDGFTTAMHHLPERMAARLAFMSRDHHTVRDFAVREMPRQRHALSARQIASVTGLELGRVEEILDELQRKLFFLVRDSRGDVNWAFPVTTSRTAHRLSFSTGERIFGACAEDAFATSFVQGRLRGEKLSVLIKSECKHCSGPLRLRVDDQLTWSVLSPGAAPLLFEPDMDWSTFRAANIIHDY